MHPIAIHIGNLPIYWYGILVALGFIFGFSTAAARARGTQIRSESILDLAPWLLGGAIIGARVVHVISYWKTDFAPTAHPFIEAFRIYNGGLVFYGGLIGASLTTIIYCHLRNMPLWKSADILAPSIALGHVFGRLGCLMTGCCYGTATSCAWAIHFPPTHETHGIGVHPTQLYESSLNLVLYGFLAWLFRRRKFDGQIFAIYLMAYALVRFFVEFFRGDYKPEEYFMGVLRPGQLMSVLIMTIGVVLYLVRQKKNELPDLAHA